MLNVVYLKSEKCKIKSLKHPSWSVCVYDDRNKDASVNEAPHQLLLKSLIISQKLNSMFYFFDWAEKIFVGFRDKLFKGVLDSSEGYFPHKLTIYTLVQLRLFSSMLTFLNNNPWKVQKAICPLTYFLHCWHLKRGTVKKKAQRDDRRHRIQTSSGSRNGRYKGSDPAVCVHEDIKVCFLIIYKSNMKWCWVTRWAPSVWFVEAEEPPVPQSAAEPTPLGPARRSLCPPTFRRRRYPWSLPLGPHLWRNRGQRTWQKRRSSRTCEQQKQDVTSHFLQNCDFNMWRLTKLNHMNLLPVPAHWCYQGWGKEKSKEKGATTLLAQT